MEPSEPRKRDNFGKSSKFPGIPAGNFRDRRFQGIPEQEFPVALVFWTEILSDSNWCFGLNAKSFSVSYCTKAINSMVRTCVWATVISWLVTYNLWLTVYSGCKPQRPSIKGR